jgi:hypothetical protein
MHGTSLANSLSSVFLAGQIFSIWGLAPEEHKSTLGVSRAAL